MLYNKENPHGGDLYSQKIILDYSANINPLGTPESVKEAVRNSLDSLSHYPDPYARELVSAIAGYENVKREFVFCGSGAAELIFSYCNAIDVKKALILAPTFSEYETALLSAGTSVERYHLKEENDFLLSEDFLEYLKKSDAKLLMLCNPNNPTGKTIDKGLLERIVLVCKEKGIRLFVDECFLDLTDEYEELTLKNILSENEHIFILKAFTKSYGMAGLRLGYCLTADEKLLSRMSDLVQPWNISIPAQAAGIAALKERAFVEKAKDIVREESPKLSEKLKSLGLSPINSKTNYILFKGPKDLKERLLEKGILIRSCSNYYGLDETWFRIAVKMPEENDQLSRSLEEILNG